MSLVCKDALLDAQWLRTAGHSIAGGAEVNECFVTARHIRGRDPGNWFACWNQLAERLLVQAETCRDTGHLVSALGSYLRAANYFRTAYTMLLGEVGNPRPLEAFRQQRSAFQAASALMPVPAERISIPYDFRSLYGYLFRPVDDRQPRKTLIINGGYDSTAEELYFFSGAAALARGYTVITFDGPGQGSAIFEDGLTFRPDWENVIRPVVNYAIARPEVDASKIALMGMSFGGCLAPRAASGEPRLAALIADPGEFSMWEELESRMPGFLARGVAESKPLSLALLKFIMKQRLRHPTKGWGVRRGLWVHGCHDVLEFVQLMREYTNDGYAQEIRCPTLVCQAELDEIGVSARRLYDTLTCEKEFMTFSAAEGAGGHCECGARSVFNQRAFDWLDDVLDSNAPARQEIHHAGT